MNRVELNSDFLADKFVLGKNDPRKKPPPHPEMDEERPERKPAAVRWTVKSREVPNNPNLHAFQQNLTSDLSGLVTQYLIHNGPESVRAMLRSKGSMGKIRAKSAEGNIVTPESVPAFGRVFERLAYHWLSGQSHLMDGNLLLDPGGATRLFSRLSAWGQADFTPDGVIIDTHGAEPQILALLEYKLNPKASDPADQIEKIKRFLAEYGGQSLTFPATILDIATGLRSTSVGISQAAVACLVIPNLPSGEDPRCGTRGILTSFGPNFVSELTHATLQDIT